MFKEQSIPLSMIIPVYNGTEFISKFFDSIDIYGPSWEIIFVDNGSTDNSFEELTKRAASLKNCIVLKYTDKQSSYAARNEGVRHASGRVLMFTDIDCLVTPTYLAEIDRLNLSNPLTMHTGPTEIFFNVLNVYEFFDKAAYLKQEEYAQANYAATANLIVSMDLYTAAGGFPEFTSGADNKFCKNCFKDTPGVTLEFNRKLSILHPARSSLREHISKAKRLGTGSAEFFLDEERNLAHTMMFILKNILGMVFSPNNMRIYLTANKYKNLHMLDKLKLLLLCWMLPYCQRKNVVKTVLFTKLKNWI